MTVEIRELIIRVVAGENADNCGTKKAGSTSSVDKASFNKAIEEAVEQSMEILEKKKER